MWPYRLLRASLAGLFLSLFSIAEGEEMEDPAAKWVTVYGWSQTGDRLAAAGQWALAMGSYIESFQQIKALAEKHPSFETELIAYRSAKLEATMAEAGEHLNSDEHATMMKYLDFIESLELGLSQRFSNQYEESLATLDIAKSLLDDLIGKKPPEFREAIDSQYLRVEDNIAWLRSQIDYKETSRLRPSVVLDGRDWGTTRFIKAEDLPDSKEGAFVSGVLFPEVAGQKGPDDPAMANPVVESPGGIAINPGEVEAKPVSKGAIRFRMNSQQKPDEAGADSR